MPYFWSWRSLVGLPSFLYLVESSYISFISNVQVLFAFNGRNRTIMPTPSSQKKI